MASNYTKGLYNDYQKLIEENKELKKKYKMEKLRVAIAESEQQI